MSYKILVSIVNWNDSAGTNRCLSGIAKLPKEEQPDVVVVDNDSRRQDLVIGRSVSQALRSLKVVRNKQNLGFAGGHSPNIRNAKEAGYDFVILLNNDTEIIDGQLFKKLAVALADKPEALGANPTILSQKNPDKIWYGGGRMSLKSASVSHRQVGSSNRPEGSPRVTGFLTGGCLAIALKRADLEQLRLNRDYFMYWEDADWCARARRAGFKLLYVPEARLLHEVSGALGIRSPFYIYYNIRNHLLFIRRNTHPVFWPLAWAGLSLITARYKFNILFRYENGRWAALKSLWAGWRDGLVGKTGQTRKIV